jgi:hypothetical protein
VAELDDERREAPVRCVHRDRRDERRLAHTAFAGEERERRGQHVHGPMHSRRGARRRALTRSRAATMVPPMRTIVPAMLALLTACGADAAQPTAPSSAPFGPAEPEGDDGYASQMYCAPDDQDVRVYLSGFALRVALPEGLERRIEAIDASGTRRAGASRAIELAAIDGSARALAPIELEAMGLSAPARRLRALAPIQDDAGAAAARAELERIALEEDRRAETLEHYDAPASLHALEQALDGLTVLEERGVDPNEHCYEAPDVQLVVEGRIVEGALAHGAPEAAVAAAAAALYARIVETARGAGP